MLIHPAVGRSIHNDANPPTDSGNDTDRTVNADNPNAPQEAPFNIAEVPDLHIADDPVQQSEVLTAIQRENRPDRRHTEQFYHMTRTPVYLSAHKANYISNNARSAINILKQRSTIVVDPDYKVDPTLDNVLIRFDEDFLDHTLYFGNRIGIDATLPNSAVDHAWHIDITFSKTSKLWPDLKIALPFSTTGRMMYIGMRGQEEIWLAFVPRSLVHRPNSQPDMTPLHAPSTSLISPHAYMAIMFFAHCLTSIHFRDIYCAQRYPDPPTRENVRRATDIL